MVINCPMLLFNGIFISGVTAHNPEIDWKKAEVRMTRYPPLCGKREKARKISERKEEVRR